MELTNIEISNHINALNQIKTKVTGKLGFIVAKNLRKLINEFSEFECVRNQLINKYGTVDEQGTFGIKAGTEAYNSFLKEIQEYYDIKQDVSILKVDVDTICNSSLNADEILKLDFMIIDDEQD